MADFEALYRQHVGTVFRYALKCVGRRELAEDITSDAFLALYRHLDEIDVSQLPGWLFTVARNRAIDYWRHRALEERHVVESRNPPPNVSQESSLEEWLTGNLALKPIHRICLVLRYVHGFGREEIASYVGLSQTQVKGHLQYGRELLRKQLVKAKRYEQRP